MKYISDEDCISRILQNDHRAFAVLIERYKAMVFTIAMRIIGCKEEAEDLAQDVFLKIYNTLHTFKGNAKFSTWLYSITYNAAISHVRKSKPAFIPFQNNIADTADESGDNLSFDAIDTISLQYDELQKLLQELKEEELLLINMYYTEDLSIEEISQVTKLSESNVKIKLFRIRKNLQQKMNYIKNNK